MQPTRTAVHETPAAQEGTFTVPEATHLLITTPRHIFAWDTHGVHLIFQSSRNGIVAAREAGDGSGLLAVASKNVVVMHDTKRGREDSWGLPNAPEEEVRHLEYSHDAACLFLSTTSDAHIYRYSTTRAVLLDPVPQTPHVSPPVALAISPSGHMILSASSHPPLVYLNNLTHHTTSTLLQPNASLAPVTCAAFHPERPNVFLLAFKDGTVAAYDANSISIAGATTLRRHTTSGNDGQLSRFLHLHRSAVPDHPPHEQATLAASIAGAAFLPGFKTRAVTAGRDGRCRIIDFAGEGVVLRTWHVKAPLTSISLLPLKHAGKGKSRRLSIPGSKRVGDFRSHTIGGPTTTNSIIALGRVDGKVCLYDTVGLRLAQKAVSPQEEKILSVAWVTGPSPGSIANSDAGHISEVSSMVVSQPMKSRISAPQDQAVSRESTSAAPIAQNGLGLPLGLKASQKQAPKTERKFTVHPDEAEANTVRRMPRDARKATISYMADNYHDLFSPIKSGISSATPPRKPILGPPRTRPRISSQTFAQKSAVKASKVSTPLSRAQEKNSHSTTSSSSSTRQRPGRPVLHVSRQASPIRTNKRHITFKPDVTYGGDGAPISRDNNASANATILAGLREMAKQHGELHDKGGILSAYGPCSKARQQLPRKSIAEISASPSGTCSASPFSSEVEEKDIWLTSSSQDETSQKRQRKARKPMIRPSVRQTLPPRAECMDVFIPTMPVNPHITNPQPLDGSTEEDMITATSHQWPVAGFSPASDQVRQLFPRSSSLSPRKYHSPAKRARRSPSRKEATLTAQAVNTTLGRQSKSPWVRAKAGKMASNVRNTSKSFRKNEFVTVLHNGSTDDSGLTRSPSFQGLTCQETQARMRALEGEVFQLKAEVLAMKAVLRRNGLPFPARLHVKAA